MQTQTGNALPKADKIADSLGLPKGSRGRLGRKDSTGDEQVLKASAKGNFEDVQRKVQATADLFEVIGEVPSGAVSAEVKQ